MNIWKTYTIILMCPDISSSTVTLIEFMCIEKKSRRQTVQRNVCVRALKTISICFWTKTNQVQPYV